MNQMPAIVAIGYNRKDSLERLLNSILAADYPDGEIPLIISIDHHPDNQPIIDLANSICWEHGPKIVKTHEKRMGLDPHVLECGNYCSIYGCAILLEDDVFVAKDFYRYTLAAQEFYADCPQIAGVALYSFVRDDKGVFPFIPQSSPWDTYFVGKAISWGQSWTAAQWEAFLEWYHAHPVLERSNVLPNHVWDWPSECWDRYFWVYMADTKKYLVSGYFARSTCFAEIGQHAAHKDIRCQARLMCGVPESYRFAPFDQGVKYDAFLESTELQPYLDAYTGGQPVRVAIHGEHLEGPESFLLTTEALPYAVVADFAFEMNPPEQNIIYGIPGNDIHLYDLSKPAPRPENRFVWEQHELCTLSVKDLLKYCWFKIIRKIRWMLRLQK